MFPSSLKRRAITAAILPFVWLSNANATALGNLAVMQKQAGVNVYNAMGTWGMVIGLFLAIGGIVQMVTAHKKNEPKTIGVYMFLGGAGLVSLSALLTFGAQTLLGSGASLSSIATPLTNQ